MGDIYKMDGPDDPNRCQAVIPQSGQCCNKAVKTEEGKYGQYCLAHGGNRFVQSEKNRATRNYRLDRFKDRLNRHATSDGIKDLRDEIGILRMCMEERLNHCKDNTDLILQSGPISDLVLKIEKVVTSCHKLEGQMGQVLDKSAILQFASEVIDIVGATVTNDSEIEIIGNKIMEAVGRIGTNESI